MTYDMGEDLASGPRCEGRNCADTMDPVGEPMHLLPHWSLPDRCMHRWSWGGLGPLRLRHARRRGSSGTCRLTFNDPARLTSISQRSRPPGEEPHRHLERGSNAPSRVTWAGDSAVMVLGSVSDQCGPSPQALPVLVVVGVVVGVDGSGPSLRSLDLPAAAQIAMISGYRRRPSAARRTLGSAWLRTRDTGCSRRLSFGVLGDVDDRAAGVAHEEPS
jgi:hypothetical protein